MSATPHKLSEQASRLSRVEIFQSGRFRNKRYTVSDLDDMVNAFHEYSSPRPNPNTNKGRLDVPGVIGHSEDQSVLHDTGLAAAAWVERIYRRGKKLYADFADVAPQVMHLIRGRRYRKVSAEVYDSHPDGLATAGTPKKMLRRVAFLGGEIPQVKTLADIPIPHSEAEYGRDGKLTHLVAGAAVAMPGGYFSCYSEVAVNDEQAAEETTPRDELVEKLQAHGVDAGALEDCPDAALAEWLRTLDAVASELEDANMALDDLKEKKKPDEEAVPVEEGKTPPGTEHDEPDGDEEKKPAEMGEDEDAMPQHPGDAAGPEKMAAYHHAMAARYMEKCGGANKNAEDVVSQDTLGLVKGKVKGEGEKMSEKTLSARLAETNRKIAEADRFAEQRLQAERKASIEAELDAAVRAGKLLPAQREARRTLLHALPTEKVHKFSEGGKVVEKSALDLAVEELRSGPVLVRFGERVGTVKGKESEDAEVAKVEEHYEQFAEEFAGKLTKEKLVAGFKAERARNPKLKAAEFLSV